MSAVASRPQVTPDRPPRVRWGVVAAAFALATVLRFLYFYLDDLTRAMHDTFVRRALEEGTGNFASALLFPIALLLERRFPVDEGRWRRTGPCTSADSSRIPSRIRPSSR